jgi:hypothetical protein
VDRASVRKLSETSGRLDDDQRAWLLRHVLDRESLGVSKSLSRSIYTRSTSRYTFICQDVHMHVHLDVKSAPDACAHCAFD